MFSIEKTVAYSDIASGGYADLACIADYLQDCAAFHSDSVGGGSELLKKEKGCVWLLASWQIIVDRYPRYGEKLKIFTQPYGFDRVFANRNFMICDEAGERIVSADSYWFLLDMNTGLPLRMREDVSGAYQLAGKMDMAYEPRKVRAKAAVRDEGMVSVARAYIDTNMHMNNAWYIRLAMEYLPPDFMIRQVRVEYRKAALYPDKIRVFTGRTDTGRIQILMKDEHDDIYAALEFAAAEE